MYPILRASLLASSLLFSIFPTFAEEQLAQQLVDVRTRDGVSQYFKRTNGLPLQGEFLLTREDGSFTQAGFDAGLPHGHWQT